MLNQNLSRARRSFAISNVSPNNYYILQEPFLRPSLLERAGPIEEREMKELSAFVTVAVLAVSLLLLASHLIAKEAAVFDQVIAKLTVY